MNVKKGVFRIWIVISFLWSILIGILAYEAMTSPFAFPEEYFYVPQLKSKNERPDWTRPFYELNVKPGTGPEKEKFSELDWDEKKKWEESGRLAASTGIRFEDGTLLYIPTEIIKSDGRKLGEYFLSQKWERYLDKLWPYIAGLIIPPAILFLLGASFVWIVRGFKSPEM